MSSYHLHFRIEFFIFGLSSIFFYTYFYVSIYIVKNDYVQPSLGVVADRTLILGMWFKSQHKILIFFVEINDSRYSGKYERVAYKL